MKRITITFPHKAKETGGPGSFQTRLINNLVNKGYQVEYSSFFKKPDCIIVVAGTRRLFWLFWNWINGVRIIHRLDGFSNSEGSVKAFLINKSMFIISKYLADAIVYQSQYVKKLWTKKHNLIEKQSVVIYNSVKLSDYSVRIAQTPYFRIICVEGNIQSDNQTKNLIIETSVLLLERNIVDRVQLIGGISKKLYDEIKSKNDKRFEIIGKIPRDTVVAYQSYGAIHFVLEFNPPCPNSVIESLAAGVPVVGISTGSLSELIGLDAGILIDTYLDNTGTYVIDYTDVANAIKKIVENYDFYSLNARKRATEMFDIEIMSKKYIDLFL